VHADNIRARLSSLPTGPGVYQFTSGKGEVLYIGKAVNLRNRVRHYFQAGIEKNPRLKAMTSKIDDVEVFVTDSEVEALILETTLIKQRKPRYNVDLKDDKSYPYIVITNEPYPRVFATRRVVRDGSKYIGPFTDVGSMHASLKMIRDLYMVRSCNFAIDDEVIRKKKIRVCLDYHIGKCEGPCEGLVSRERYGAMIDEVGQLLRGRTAALAGRLRTEMEKASAEQRFEEAASLRDRMTALDVYNQRQKIVDLDQVDRDLIAVALRENDGCCVVFRVREGKIAGKQQFFVSSARGSSEREVVEQFLGTYYLEKEDIPREVHLQVKPEHGEVLAGWLGQKRGGKVDIIVPKIGEKAKLLKLCLKNAELSLGMMVLQKEKRRATLPPAVELLGKDLGLPKSPRRIECFDISHTQGADTVGSLVVFVDGVARKSEYRIFNLESANGPDDFASMRETVRRRYVRVMAEGTPLPDLIVIDGGKGQLASALEVIAELGIRPAGESNSSAAGNGRPALIGLAKRLEEIYHPGITDPQSIPKSSPGLKLLQKIRNEAHRFAVSHHRSRRARRTLQTELDLIAGVGKKRANQLLGAFGSVQGVRFATTEQIGEIVGEATALKIRQYFELPPESTRGG